MTRPERRREQKKYRKDFAAFCRITRQYFPDFIRWLQEIKDPRKFRTYETEVMLMTVIMKNICSITSMQKMTDEFLSSLDTGELEHLRKSMIRALLRRRKFEDARFLGKYWLVIIDATGLFHFPERHCPHCLKKVVNKGTAEEKKIYYHHVLEAKLVLGDGLWSASGRNL